MPRGNDTSPPGGFGRRMGPSRGRGMGSGKKTARGGMRGTMPGAGPGGECICFQCGIAISHRQGGIPCNQIHCSQCGTPMVRK